MQLEVFYRDGTADTIVSGEGWRITNRGPIRKANEFDGETYDARLDLGSWTLPRYNDSQWQDAVVDYDLQNMNLEDRFNPAGNAATTSTTPLCLSPTAPRLQPSAWNTN